MLMYLSQHPKHLNKIMSSHDAIQEVRKTDSAYRDGCLFICCLCKKPEQQQKRRCENSN